MLDWFLNLTEEELEEFIKFRKNFSTFKCRDYQQEQFNTDIKYLFGPGFKILIKWLENCCNCRTLLLLRYSDEINKLPQVFGKNADVNPPIQHEFMEYFE